MCGFRLGKSWWSSSRKEKAYFGSAKNSLNKLVKLYVDEIVMLYGVPISIISDRSMLYISILAESIKGSGYEVTF